jgi:ribosomal-protein-alanine acetyltransferase
MTPPLLRLGSQRDVEALFRLEKAAYERDLFTEDQIEYLLTRAHATVIVAEDRGATVGAAYMLWRKSLSLGRLYNIVVDPSRQGEGLGARLLDECELEAARRGCAQISLEVRVDNDHAIRFYKKRRYRVAAEVADYYEDGTTAFKMIHELKLAVPDRIRLKIPYHAQTLDFTCGPSCLMMAFKFFDPRTALDRNLELELWREATLIFMTTGVGGTGPYGLALAARRRGFSARVLSSTDKAPFVASVRSPDKREVIRLVHRSLKEDALEAGVAAATYDFKLDDITSAVYRGLVPITLISTYRLTGDRAPHWVVVTGFDRDSIFIHDPDEASYHHDRIKARNIRVSRGEFQRMSRYGKEVYRSAILIGPAVAD